jgi:hypothetical protein
VIPGCCEIDDDCNDTDDCTADSCVDNACLNEAIPDCI